MKPRHWEQDTPYGRVVVVTSARGLRAIGYPDDDDLPELIGDTEASRDARVAKQLDRWFAGRARTLDIPLDLDGVEGFKRDALETLARDVGWGETVSYGELAEMAGRPRAARAVGSAMASNPLPFVIPCHRVIAAGGKIGGFGNGRNSVALKRQLLAREGVTL
jgi:methylated-DNA-[protein]-cysteine S-methyltransferase